MRKLAISLILLGVIAIAGWACGLALPTLSWPFQLHVAFGYICSIVVLVIGIGLLCKRQKHFNFKPMTVRRLQRFKSIRRGYVAFILLIAMILLAALDQLVVGKRALVVYYDGQLSFPALMQNPLMGEQYGLTGDAAVSEPNYRKLKKDFARDDKGNWLLMPLIPYDSSNDSIPAVSESLELRDGVYFSKRTGLPYSGLAASLYDVEEPTSMHIRYRLREGIKQGVADGWDEQKERVYSATYQQGNASQENYSGAGALVDFLNAEVTDLRIVHYNPAPPLPAEKLYLGTNSKGLDVIAYLYGGLQVNIKAALLYIPCVYLIGVTVGLLMGYFGGTVDILVQRLIEIFSNIPFLFVVLIMSSLLPDQLRGLGLILAILILFGWMGMTYLMRTAALKEKQRDYVAAARVLGASTPRIIFRHILPNSVAILVTLIPFSVSGIVLALTSLDYLGFGLPSEYATWGQLLQDGLNNLSSPWIVSSAFTMLVLLLVLVTFVGEAIREAFDPKKFTTYR